MFTYPMQKADVHVGIISARRPHFVENTLRFFEFPDSVWWYVTDGDAAAYEAAGASNVVEVGPYGHIHHQRNRHLREAWWQGHLALAMSDDCKWMRYAPSKSREDWYEIHADVAIEELVWGLELEPRAHLAGISPTNNPFFVTGTLNPNGFCFGDLYLVRECGLYFRKAAIHKDDYDYTAQHLVEFGAVARMDRILTDFNHANTEGGTVGLRSDEKNERAIQHLLDTFPGAYRRHPTREGEVRLQWPPKKGSPLYEELKEKHGW